MAETILSLIVGIINQFLKPTVKKIIGKDVQFFGEFYLSDVVIVVVVVGLSYLGSWLYGLFGGETNGLDTAANAIVWYSLVLKRLGFLGK